MTTTKTIESTQRTSFASQKGFARSVEEIHDRLVRCKACELKYDPSELQFFGGHHICKYCIIDMEQHLGGNYVQNNSTGSK